MDEQLRRQTGRVRKDVEQQPYLIGTTNMIADLFTKALDKGQFYQLRDVMMNHHAPRRDALSIAMCQMHGSASRLAGRLSRQL